MLQRCLVIIIAFYLLLSANIVFAQGREVSMLLHDGRQMSGELVSVRDSTMVIHAGDTQYVVIKNNDIKSITVRGTSTYPLWLGLGSFVGVVSGAIIGREIAIFNQGYGASIGGLVGAGCGLLVGTIIASATSTEDIGIDSLTKKDLVRLKLLSRYPENESEYIKQL
jgi:hypothetical protein